MSNKSVYQSLLCSMLYDYGSRSKNVASTCWFHPQALQFLALPHFRDRRLLKIVQIGSMMQHICPRGSYFWFISLLGQCTAITISKNASSIRLWVSYIMVYAFLGWFYWCFDPPPNHIFDWFRPPQILPSSLLTFLLYVVPRPFSCCDNKRGHRTRQTNHCVLPAAL